MSLLSPVAQGVALKEFEVGGIKLEICPVSGGIWFDNYELNKFDEAHETDAEKLFHLPFDPCFEVDNETLRVSPRHPDIVMQRRVFGVRQEVEIDVCPMSGGIWLDRGELQKIRDLYPNEDEKEKLADEFAAEYIANDPEAKAERAQAESLLRRSRGFNNMFRWLCPSRYVKA